MKRTIDVLSLLSCLALLGTASAQTVQLAEGRLLLATVESATGEGCVVKRIDNGGTLELRWDQLAPATANAIKRQNNLISDVEDEILVRAEEVEYELAGRKQTIIGKIVERSGNAIVVQKRGTPYRIPIDNVQVRQIDVPVAEVYTADEWYAVRLAKIEDPSNADEHMLMAEDLIKVRDYEHAKLHLDKARELDNSKDPGRLDSLFTKLERYRLAAKERELLDSIQACRSRGTASQFKKGLELIAQFESEFPEARLQAEFDVEKDRFVKARERYLARQIADNFRRSIRSIAERKVIEQGLTLQAARDYAENQMTDDLFARVAQQYDLEVEEVQTLWGNRENYPGGKRTEHFGYGIGSWVLGEQNILKGTNVEKAQGQQKSQRAAQQNSREIERVARALKQALERRRAASSGGAGQQQQQTDEDWWRTAKRKEKAGWLRAYYAEYGGQLKVTYASVAQCVSCYGQGTTPDMGPDGKVIRTPCFLCQNTKWMRSFKAY